MQYMGGKTQTASRIARLINDQLQPGQTYLEPFCGSCAVTVNVSAKTRIVGDASLDLVLMWSALQQGWQPPMSVSRSKYEELKSASPSALRAFVGFQCSVMGGWFRGWSYNSTRPPVVHARRRRLLATRFRLADVIFCCADYRSWRPRNAVVYCDPPYLDTSNLRTGASFDHRVFWNQVREWSLDNTVYVSEYKAPDDFEEVLKMTRRASRYGLDNRSVVKTEKVFVYRVN